MTRHFCFRPCSLAGSRSRLLAAAAGALAGTLLVTACAPVPKRAPEPPPVPVIHEVYVPIEVPVPVPEVNPADVAVRDALAYHDKVRQMSPAELSREFARLDPPANPAATLEFALALGQTHFPWDTARALSLLEPLLRSTDPQVAPWQPLARLLATRYAEQKRVEEHAERQTQLLRDTQRRLEQATQQLEALKAIERSLSPKPAASGAGAGSGASVPISKAPP